jgi:hypothetical protein
MPARDTMYTETAIIQFKIFKDGTIINVKCINSDLVSIALKDEAIRLISSCPLWIPAQRNGRHTVAYRVEKISITVSPLYL